jgi:hypothetical protein
MKPTHPAYIRDDHGERHRAGEVAGCGTGVLLFAIAVVLIALCVRLC